MNTIIYEKHIHNDKDFPFYFHASMQKNPLNFKKDNYRFHWHESLEILRTIKGVNIVYVNGGKITMSENEFVIVNSGNLHSVQSVGEHSIHQCLIIDKSFTDEFGISVLDIYFTNLIRDDYPNTIFDQITEELADKKDFYKENVKSYIILLLTYLYRNYKSSSTPAMQQNSFRSHEITKEIIDCLHKSFTSDINISSLATQLGFNSYYLCHVFHNSTGMTIGDYIRELRVSYATKLISTGNYSIREIAEMSGFNTPSYFSKIYKRQTGYLPNDVKEKHKN